MSPTIPGLVDLTEVGRGGFGTVYRATDERFGRRVAVKVIRDAGLGKDVKARFERECRALGSLSGHPNIVAVHDSGTTEDGELYLVMEYLGGGSLAQRLADRGPADPLDVAEWGAALAGALETAHRSGIVHRDVKPENALFSDYGALKLVDFGIARMRSAYETRSGFISATLSHAAPEIVAGAPISPAADVYSLASVLFTMMYGHAPFDRGHEESLAPLIARIVNSEPPDLREIGVPDAIAETIERGLSKTPGERYESAAEFGFSLQAASRDSGGGDVPVPVGDADDVAEAAAVVASGPATPSAQNKLPVVGSAHQTGSHTAQVARRRPPAQQVITAPPPKSRTRLVLVAVAAVLALVLGGLGAYAVWGPSDAPEAGSKVDDKVAPAAATVQVADTPTRTSGMGVKRTYAVKDGKSFQSAVALKNNTKKTITRVWPEVIPKQLALDVSEVTFSPQPTEIVDPDPIVIWKLRLKPGATRSITWSTAVPEGKKADKAFVTEAMQWHRQAIASSAAVVDTAVRKASGKNQEAIVSAGESIGGGFTGGGSGGTLYDGGTAYSGGTTYSGGATGGGGGGGLTGSGGGGGTGSGGGSAGVKQPSVSTVRANRPPVITVGNRASDELVGVSFTVGVSDPDGDGVNTSVSGLPAGVGSSGARVSGQVSHNAASVTNDRRQGIRSRNFGVTVTARDSRGLTSRRTFTWTVRDTHRLMPYYIGKYGNENPDVAAVSSPSFGCFYDPNGRDSTIHSQGVPASAVIRWGQPIKYVYVSRKPC